MRDDLDDFGIDLTDLDLESLGLDPAVLENMGLTDIATTGLSEDEAAAVEAELGPRYGNVTQEEPIRRRGMQLGARDSGTGIVLPNAAPVTILGHGKGLPQFTEDRGDGTDRVTMPGGVAVVHVSVRDNDNIANGPIDPGVAYRQRLIFDVMWQNGNGGGSAQIDGTGGCIFSLGGVHAVQLTARLVDTDGGVTGTNDFAPPVLIGELPGPAQIVEAVIFWKSAVQPKPTFMTSRRLSLLAGIPSAYVRIPAQAHSMIMATDTPASSNDVTAEFACSPAGAAPAMQRTLDPLVNGTVLKGGVNYVRFTAAMTNQIVTGIFELCL